MKRVIGKKVVAVLCAISVVASLLIVSNVTKTVSAGSSIQMGMWSFTHQGPNAWGEPGNEGVITNVTLDSGETINNWPDKEYTNTATQYAKGFNVAIDRVGWDRDWGTGSINPWSVQATNTTEVIPGHDYEVRFKTKSSKQKYIYIYFGCEIEGSSIQGDGEPIEGGLVGGGEVSNNQIISSSTVEKTYSYKFTNMAGAKNLNINLMMGAFATQTDFSGRDISDVVIETEQWNYEGVVGFSDFEVIDNGLNPDYNPKTSAPARTTTAKTTTSQLPSDIAGLEGKIYSSDDYLIYWDASNYALFYNVYLNGKLVGNTTETYYFINNNNFEKNGDYLIEVEAVNSYGKSQKSSTIYSYEGGTDYEDDTTEEDDWDDWDDEDVPEEPRAVRGLEDKNNNYYVYWESNEDAYFYNVYVNDQLVANTLSTYCLIPASFFQSGDEEYNIEVEAVNENGTSERASLIYYPSENKITTKANKPTAKKIVRPAKVSIKKTKNLKKRKIKVTWNRQKNITGYQIAYANNKAFTKNYKTKNVAGNKGDYVLKNMKKKKTYWIKVRSYVGNGTSRIYGLWSNAKKTKVKK